MSKTLRKRWISLFLALLMCLSLLVIPAVAEDEEEPTSQAFSVEDGSEERVSLQITGGDLMNDGFAEEQDDEGLALGTPSDIFEDEESLGGTEELSPEGNSFDLGGDDDTLGFGEDIGPVIEPEELEEFKNTQVEFGEGSDLDLSDDDETVEDDDPEDLGLFGATVSASTSSLILKKGTSTTVNISYTNAPKNGSLKAGAWKNVILTSDAVSLSWGKASGGKAPLTIRANKTGSCYVEVFLCNSLGIPYASTQIKVNVCEASLTCTSSLDNVKVHTGSSKTLYFKASGYSGTSEITYTTTNTSSYTCSLSSGTMTITGKKVGSGTVSVYYKAKATGDILASLSFKVTVESVSVVPKLTVSSSSLSLSAGASQDITVSYSGYSGTVYYTYSSNSSAVSCQWIGGWNGNSHSLRITGKQTGSATVTVALVDDNSKKQLTTAKIQVSVVPEPMISPTSATLNLESGKAGTVTFTLKNVSDKNRISGVIQNSNVCSATLSKKNDGYVLTVVGKNTGDTTITVSILDANGRAVKNATVSVHIKEVPPSLTPSSSSLSINAGETKSVTFTCVNCSGSVSLKFAKSSSNCTLE